MLVMFGYQQLHKNNVQNGSNISINSEAPNIGIPMNKKKSKVKLFGKNDKESVRSRVAMDFTGSVGRIVEDPKEAKAIAAAEGYSWRRRWRPSTRAQAPPHSPVTQQGIDSGVHITQPWFHSGMSRDQAAALVTRYGTVDGVFLVRDSRSNPGAFVLTYKCGGKVLHTQITPILDPVREAYVFTLDNGFTKFYDLLQLVEFYQLNAGVLPTRLTHYVVQSPTGISVPASNVSPSVAGSF